MADADIPNSNEASQTQTLDTTNDKTSSDLKERTRSTSNVTNKLDEFDEQFGEVFTDSVYRDLIYYGKTKSCNGLTLSLMVLISQIICYSIFVTEGLETISKDNINVSINWFDCDDANFDDLALTDYLVCEAEVLEGMRQFFSWLLPTLLLSAFTYGDILACIKAIRIVDGKWATFSALLILFMEFYALYAAALFSYIGSYTAGSLFDSIVNCVGVLFIHDMDNKVYEGFIYLQKNNLPNFISKRNKCKRNIRVITFLIWTFICFLFVYLSVGFF